jgi:hypothetical protein
VNLSRAGLVQVSPEKLSQGVAKFGQYQAAMAEFINLLYLPMRKSLQVMQDEMTELAWEEGLDADFKQYYKKWLKILEGQYLTLSKSPQYRRTLAYVLNALVDFTVAKQALLAEALRFLPFPSPQEMDALYQEIYLLKKRLKEVERRMAKPGTS